MTPEQAAAVQLLALDVDGVLTDGAVVYGDRGEELKAFHIRDGLGIKLLQRGGIEVALITGRRSPMVERRAAELGIAEVVMGREDKRSALEELCRRRQLEIAHCAYMGDDLPDLAAVRAAGLGLTVADACAEVIDAADWVSTLTGGRGAVREACEALLRLRGQFDALVATYL